MAGFTSRRRSSLSLFFGVQWVSLVWACNSASRPTPYSPPPPPPAVETIAVQVQGHVINDDRDEPIPGAVVTINQILSGGGYRPPNESATATTDMKGEFLLTANLPADWREMRLGITQPGYEPTGIYIRPSEVTNAVLRVYPTLTIRPGESIATHVSLGSYVCGDESVRCRRVVVESLPGESIDLEVSPADRQEEIGLMADSVFFSFRFERQVTVSRGVVWIVVGPPARVMLTARRHFAKGAS